MIIHQAYSVPNGFLEMLYLILPFLMIPFVLFCCKSTADKSVAQPSASQPTPASRNNRSTSSNNSNVAGDSSKDATSSMALKEMSALEDSYKRHKCGFEDGKNKCRCETLPLRLETLLDKYNKLISADCEVQLMKRKDLLLKPFDERTKLKVEKTQQSRSAEEPKKKKNVGKEKQKKSKNTLAPQVKAPSPAPKMVKMIKSSEQISNDQSGAMHPPEPNVNINICDYETLIDKDKEKDRVVTRTTQDSQPTE